MKEPRPTTVCLRCRQPYSLHSGNGHESTRRCPTRDGSTFRRSIQHPGASQSFTEREVMVLDHVTRTLLRGGDLRNLVVAHSDTLQNLARKAAGMKRTAAARKVTP